MGYIYSFFYFLIVLAILGTLLVGYWEIWGALGLLFGFFNIIFLFLMKMRSTIVKKEIYSYIAFFVFPCIYWIFGGTSSIIWIYIASGVILFTMTKSGIVKFFYRPDRIRRDHDKLIKEGIIPPSWQPEERKKLRQRLIDDLKSGEGRPVHPNKIKELQQALEKGLRRPSIHYSEKEIEEYKQQLKKDLERLPFSQQGLNVLKNALEKGEEGVPLSYGEVEELKLREKPLDNNSKFQDEMEENISRIRMRSKEIFPVQEILSIKKSYRPEELDRITQNFSAMIYSYTPGFLYGTLKACEIFDREQEIQNEDSTFLGKLFGMDSGELLEDENRAKDFSRLTKKYGSDMVNELYMEIKSYFIFMVSILTEKVLDKDDFRSFLSHLDKIAKEDAERLKTEYKEHAYLKYTLTKNPHQEFSRNIFIILKRLSLYLYMLLVSGVSLFFIHVMPVIARGILEGKVSYEMKRKGVKIDLRGAMAWYKKGTGLSMLKNPEQEIECYDKALKINPRDAEAWYNKGVALYHLGKSEQEIECYDKVLEINPRFAMAWTKKGNALDDLGQFEAIDCYDKALGKFEQAIECYDKALEINPRDTMAWYNKGVALYHLGKQDQAIECYDKLLEINVTLAKKLFNMIHK